MIAIPVNVRPYRTRPSGALAALLASEAAALEACGSLQSAGCQLDGAHLLSAGRERASWTATGPVMGFAPASSPGSRTSVTTRLPSACTAQGSAAAEPC